MSSEQPSKAKRVQEYLRTHPQARNRDAVEALAEFGVTPADVSNAKTQLRKKFSRRSASTAELAIEDPNSSISLAELDETIGFVQAVGGIARAQQLLAIVQQIRQL